MIIPDMHHASKKINPFLENPALSIALMMVERLTWRHSYVAFIAMIFLTQE